MPIFSKLPSHDQWLEDLKTKHRVLIINDIADDITYGRTDVADMMQHIIKSDVVSLTPSCDCEYYKTEYYKGIICPKCNTEVKQPVMDTSPSVWFRRIEGQPKFINPYIWSFVNSKLSSRTDSLRYLSNSAYNPPKVDPALKEVINTIPNYKRNYESLVNNFDQVLDIIFKSKSISKNKAKRESFELLFQILKLYPENIYSEHLAALPKGALIQERTGAGNYTTTIAPKQIETVIKFANACTSDNPIAHSRAMSDLIADTVESVTKFLKMYGNGKKGYFRNDLLKSRLGNTARGVIGAMSGVQDFNTIHLPWGMSVSLFLPQLINIMRNRMGYTYRKATDLLLASVHTWNADVDKAIDIMLELADNDIKSILQRNPSLMQGSALYFSIPKIKRDPNDNTIDVPPPVVAILRGDYDGDELNLILMLDMYLSNLMESFKIDNNIVSESAPYKISDRLTLTNPGNLTLSNALPTKK